MYAVVADGESFAFEIKRGKWVKGADDECVAVDINDTVESIANEFGNKESCVC